MLHVRLVRWAAREVVDQNIISIRDNVGNKQKISILKRFNMYRL